MSRNLNPDDNAALLEEEFSDVDSNDSLDDPDFRNTSDTDSSSEETESEKEPDNNPISLLNTLAPLQPQAVKQVQSTAANQDMDWKEPHKFSPRHTVSSERCCQIISDLKHSSSPLDCFMMMFPYGLCMWISQCTNERLQNLPKTIEKKDKNNKPTWNNVSSWRSVCDGIQSPAFHKLLLGRQTFDGKHLTEVNVKLVTQASARTATVAGFERRDDLIRQMINSPSLMKKFKFQTLIV